MQEPSEHGESTSHELPSSPASAAPPVLILGCHRSGTSAVAGLLSLAAGLHLGDVLPATAANPKGYFESTAIVKAHNAILASLDRDWTCPPHWMDPQDLPLEGLRRAIEQLTDSGLPWGVKDPRMLFMLPVWAHLLEVVRFVGVVREHEETVRSLIDRDGLDEWVANEIVRAHLHRLRALAEEFDFPIVDFSAGTEDVLNAVERVAGQLDLKWDPEAASGFLDPDLPGRRSRGRTDNPDELRLRELAKTQAAAEPIAATRLAAALAAIPPADDDLDRYSGPRAAARRARVWSIMPSETSPVIEFTRSIKQAGRARPAPESAQVVTCRNLLGVLETLRSSEEQFEGIVLPDVTSWLVDDDLPGLFALLHQHLQEDGVVAIGLSRADRDTRHVMGWPSIELADVCRAARGSGLVVLSQRDDPLVSSALLLAPATIEKLLRRVVPPGASSPPDSPQDDAVVREASAQVAAALAESLVWQERYERLHARKSVRAALAVARLAAPVFRLARRRSGRTRGS